MFIIDNFLQDIMAMILGIVVKIDLDKQSNNKWVLSPNIAFCTIKLTIIIEIYMVIYSIQNSFFTVSVFKKT